MGVGVVVMVVGTVSLRIEQDELFLLFHRGTICIVGR